MPESARDVEELDGRTAAALAVADALTGRRFVNETLGEMRTGGRVGGREAALAMEIAQGAVRHSVTIEHLLGALAGVKKERTAPRLRAVLYTAGYQIVWMDRIPPFAAVDQAVELARRLVRGRSPGMVNAVLRRLAGAIVERSAGWKRLDPAQVRVSWDRACVFSEAVLPVPTEVDDGADHLAAATGERPERFAELCTRYESEQAESVAWASQAVPVTVLQRNPLRATPAAFEQHLREAWGAAAEIVGDAALVSPSVPVLDTPMFQDGLAYVQDSTAHAAATAVEARPGERVLDLCAAPGGKSVALALAMEDRGTVVACDSNPGRLSRVVANVTRLGLTCVQVRLVADTDAEPSFRGEPFDAALVDVPCSNTGVIARRPEARLGLTSRKLGSLVRMQKKLLQKAAQSVRLGGRLVYSTCSLEPQENEGVVEAFLGGDASWRLDVQQTTLPAWGPRCSDWRDGGYFARLKRCQ